MIKTLIPWAAHLKVDTYREALTFAKNHGFGGLDFNIREISSAIEAEGLAAVQDAFKSAGVAPAVFGLPVEWRNDEETFQSDLANLPQLAKAAADLGTSRTASWVLSGSNERPPDENLAFHLSRLQPVAQILGDYGISLGLEFIGPKTIRDTLKYPFEYTCHGMLELAKQIGPNVGLLFDTWHQYTSHGTLADISKLIAKDVVYVHVNDAPAGIEIDQQIDNKRELPGATDVIPVKAILSALVEIGYVGPVGVEPFNEALGQIANPDDRVAAVMDALNKVWPD